MLAIRLPEAIEERLNTRARETGRTKTALAREAILEYIDDLKDYYLAEARARRNRKTLPPTRWSGSLAFEIELDPGAVKDLKKPDCLVQQASSAS